MNKRTDAGDKVKKNFPVVHYTFQNLQENGMSFDEVFDHIITFMRKNPCGKYRLMIGTDSQVHPLKTTFITGIVIQNVGKGVWACIRELMIPRRMEQLHERISFETSLTEEIVSMFTEKRKNQMIEIILPFLYHGASFTLEGHIDIGAGQRNKTREFVEEMVNRIGSMGFEPKIKPHAFVASCYANRFTK